MYCEKCDQHYPADQRFCDHCGQPLVKRALGTRWIPALALAGMFAAGLLVWLFT